MTTAQQTAAVVIRMFSLWWLIDSIFYFVEVPSEIIAILHYQGIASGGTAAEQFFATQREIALGIILVKGLILFVLGLGFLVFSRPMARLFARGLE